MRTLSDRETGVPGLCPSEAARANGFQDCELGVTEKVKTNSPREESGEKHDDLRAVFSPEQAHCAPETTLRSERWGMDCSRNMAKEVEAGSVNKERVRGMKKASKVTHAGKPRKESEALGESGNSSCRFKFWRSGGVDSRRTAVRTNKTMVCVTSHPNKGACPTLRLLPGREGESA